MREYSPFPLLVDISVTNRCNLNCSYCSADSGPFARKKDELSIEMLDSLFKELDSTSRDYWWRTVYERRYFRDIRII